MDFETFPHTINSSHAQVNLHSLSIQAMLLAVLLLFLKMIAKVKQVPHSDKNCLPSYIYLSPWQFYCGCFHIFKLLFICMMGFGYGGVL